MACCLAIWLAGCPLLPTDGLLSVSLAVFSSLCPSLAVYLWLAVVDARLRETQTATQTEPHTERYREGVADEPWP
jgi:hypothetical protein